MEGDYLLSSPGKPAQKKRGCLRRLWHENWCSWLPARYVLAVMSFLGFVNVYILRVNLSVAVVVMVNNTHGSNHNDIQPHPEYNWTSDEQGLVLGAFFYGYLIMQIPGGWLAQRFGGKYVFGIGVVMTAVLTLLTPLAAQTGVWALVILRVLEGLFEGVTFPATHALWGKWAPPAERTQLVAISYSGQFAGSIISFPLTAVLCKYGLDGGWPSVFYIFGALGIIWFIFWLLLGFDSPASHPRISVAERRYIETSIQSKKIEMIPTPWFQIFTSPAVWAILVASFCGNFGFYTLLTTMPTYFQNVHIIPQEDIIENGLYSAIPFLVQFIAVLGSGVVADFLRSKCCSTQVVRKLFTCSSFLFSATFLLLCGYVGETKPIAVTFLALGVGLGGLCLAGHNINQIDIAPRFAGVMMGISNTVGTLPGFLGPQIAKLIAQEPPGTPDSDSYLNVYKDEWREVFLISAEIYVFGAIIYLILARGEKQWWADGVEGRCGGCFVKRKQDMVIPDTYTIIHVS